MGKFLKKNWFVVLVATLFIGVVGYYIYDTNKGKLKGKKANGEDVVYEINGNDTTASAFYDELYSSNGTSSAVALFKQAVADADVNTTSEMKDNAKKQAESIKSNYQSNYGSSYESYLAKDLASTGFSDLEEYLIEAQKINSITADYAKKNFDDLNIRQVSYILIKYEDTSNPSAETTDDEKKRMAAVDEELKNGTDFATVAQDHSEDSSTASKGGNLGVIDKNTTSIDSTFLSTSLALKEGEVSDWVRSDSFGYFKIMCTASTQKTLESNNTDTDPYLSLVQQYDTTLENTAIWKKAQELGIDFKGNDDIEKAIKSAFNVADDADKKSTEATATPEATTTPETTATPESSAESEAN